MFFKEKSKYCFIKNIDKDREDLSVAKEILDNTESKVLYKHK